MAGRDRESHLDPVWWLVACLPVLYHLADLRSVAVPPDHSQLPTRAVMTQTRHGGREVSSR